MRLPLVGIEGCLVAVELVEDPSRSLTMYSMAGVHQGVRLEATDLGEGRLGKPIECPFGTRSEFK